MYVSDDDERNWQFLSLLFCRWCHLFVFVIVMTAESEAAETVIIVMVVAVTTGAVASSEWRARSIKK